MLLYQIGEISTGQAVKNATLDLLRQGVRTRDLGGGEATQSLTPAGAAGGAPRPGPPAGAPPRARPAAPPPPVGGRAQRAARGGRGGARGGGGGAGAGSVWGRGRGVPRARVRGVPRPGGTTGAATNGRSDAILCAFPPEPPRRPGRSARRVLGRLTASEVGR